MPFLISFRIFIQTLLCLGVDTDLDEPLGDFRCKARSDWIEKAIKEADPDIKRIFIEATAIRRAPAA